MMSILSDCQRCEGTGRVQGCICANCRGAGRFPPVIGGYYAIQNFRDGSCAVKVAAESPWQSIRGKGARRARLHGASANFAKLQNQLTRPRHQPKKARSA
jgi:hypothetical protein